MSSIERFHVIDDAAVILRAKGVYRQAKVYRRGEALFAAHGSGFIRLSGAGGTSIPNISWIDLDVGVEPGADRFGSPILPVSK